jgi:hypothetical protein
LHIFWLNGATYNKNVVTSICFLNLADLGNFLNKIDQLYRLKLKLYFFGRKNKNSPEKEIQLPLDPHPKLARNCINKKL